MVRILGRSLISKNSHNDLNIFLKIRRMNPTDDAAALPQEQEAGQPPDAEREHER
jgi:hypothetical protein